jgi:hypothetical protein
MKHDAHGAAVRLSYRKIRDITTAEEEANGAATYIAVVPAFEILKIGTEGNLRDYIPSHPGKKRSFVHKAIGSTIRNRPDRFAQLNSGFLVGVSKIEVDDHKKSVVLHDASVNNGAQSQGEVALYIRDCEEQGEEPLDFPVRVEISVEPDAMMRTEIAIARNTATRVQDISQAGKIGYFRELDASFRETHRSLKLAMSETDVGDEFIDTRQLLQVLWVMIPAELMPEGRSFPEARMKAYKNAAFCLSDFVHIHQNRSDPKQAERFQYFVDMAGAAWTVYKHWTTHKEWGTQRLREDAKQVRRRDGKVIVNDGVVFPILSALSCFVQKDPSTGKWTLKIPSVFQEEDLITAARRLLKQHLGKPVVMGRSGAAYEGLMMLTEMAKRSADAPSVSAAAAE